MKDLFYNYQNILENENSINHWNVNSGIDLEVLKAECVKLEEQYKDENYIVLKSKLIEYILNNAQIEVNPVSLFADKINHGMIMRDLFEKRIQEIKENELGEFLVKSGALRRTRAFESSVDFGHTCPDWDYLFQNGFKGIVDNLEEQLKRNDITEDQIRFYEASKNVYVAIIQWVKRLAAEAKRLKSESVYMPIVATGLENIAESKPNTFYEVLCLICIYYELQQNLDCSYVRTLGSLDTLLIRYYEQDIAEKRLTEDDARVILRHFMYKFRSKHITANMPFTLCGSDKEGNDLTNTVTLLILEEYIKLDIQDPKIHICYHDRIDKKVLELVLGSIIDGKNSFVFMNDKVVRKALEKSGIDKDDTYGYAVVGCYEPCAYRKEIACTTNGYINIPKVVELALTNGIDLITGEQLVPADHKPIESFQEFMDRVKDILGYLCDECREVVNAFERNYMKINPTPIFSGAHEMSVKKGIDIYAGGVKYNNSSFNGLGLATAVDSLVVLKHVVFEEKALTLEQFSKILKNNWEGFENFRLKCKNLYPKYGNNLNEPDQIMLQICGMISDCINGKTNARNGVYRLGMFSIDVRFKFGYCTGASCDGRLSGESLSKNLSAVIGCDQQGVTALINSVTQMDHTNIPNGAVLDIVLHKSAVSGPEGFNALRGLLLAYMNKGGMAVHFNVLSPEELRRAQENPEQYKTLQVRLCGWNVYFVDLSRKEQDEFICQLEAAPC